MVRFLGFLVGLGFVVVAAWSLLWGVIAVMDEGLPHTVEHEFHQEPRDVAFSFDGPFGRFDQQQLQRGFQVYKEVLRGLPWPEPRRVRTRHDRGYSEAEVRAIATVADPGPIDNPDTGEPATRKAIPPIASRTPMRTRRGARGEQQCAAADLSLIVSRANGGAPRLHLFAAPGYQNPPAHLPAGEPDGAGAALQPHFPNFNIAMPRADRGRAGDLCRRQPATRDQMARDVSAFLTGRRAEPPIAAHGGWAV